MKVPEAESSCALLVIARRPSPGRSKTRLSPPLSGAQAARLYEALLEDALDVARRVSGVQRFVLHAPRQAASHFRDLAPDFGLIPQEGGGLGERLDDALSRCLNNGFTKAAVMASDSPTLPPEYARKAFELLETSDVVLGPCEDGGYYLIALSAPHPRLLREVRMSTPSVLRDTIEVARQEGLRVALLPEWHDVDTPQDLDRLRHELASAPSKIAPHTRACLRTLSR